MMLSIQGEDVHGVDVDLQTRCAHYHSDLDIIAIRFKCCGRWFPCYECHSEVAGHEANVWPTNERDAPAILCGACGRQLSIAEYLEVVQPVRPAGANSTRAAQTTITSISKQKMQVSMLW